MKFLWIYDHLESNYFITNLVKLKN